MQQQTQFKIISVSNTFDGIFGIHKKKKLFKALQFECSERMNNYDQNKDEDQYFYSDSYMGMSKLMTIEEDNKILLESLEKLLSHNCENCQVFYNMAQASIKSLTKICQENQRKLINTDKICQIIKKQDYFDKNIVLQIFANNIKPIINKITNIVKELEQNYEIQLNKISKVHAANYRLVKKSIQSKLKHEITEITHDHESLKQTIRDQQQFLNWHKQRLFELFNKK